MLAPPALNRFCLPLQHLGITRLDFERVRLKVQCLNKGLLYESKAGRLGFEPRPAVLETDMLAVTLPTYIMQSHKDSNLDPLSQSQICCRYTMGLYSR